MASDRLNQLLEFLENSPSEPFILFAVAKEYEQLKQLDEATSYYNQCIQADEDYVGTYYHLGKLYEKQGQFTNAMESYEKGILIATKIKDQHSLSELMGAKMEIED